MNTRLLTNILAVALSSLAFACADDDPADSKEAGTIAAELDTFVAQSNAKARKACGIPEHVNVDSSDEHFPGDFCYYELAVELDACERKVLEADPEMARKAIACATNKIDALITCCEADGPCSYDAIEVCYEKLEPAESDSACQAVDDALKTRTEQCEAEQAP